MFGTGHSYTERGTYPVDLTPEQYQACKEVEWQRLEATNAKVERRFIRPARNLKEKLRSKLTRQPSASTNIGTQTPQQRLPTAVQVKERYPSTIPPELSSVGSIEYPEAQARREYYEIASEIQQAERDARKERKKVRELVLGGVKGNTKKLFQRIDAATVH